MFNLFVPKKERIGKQIGINNNIKLSASISFAEYGKISFCLMKQIKIGKTVNKMKRINNGFLLNGATVEKKGTSQLSNKPNNIQHDKLIPIDIKNQSQNLNLLLNINGIISIPGKTSKTIKLKNSLNTGT